MAREVFDVSGAGDTVIATMAVMMANGMRMQDAVAMLTGQVELWSANWARRP
jgi:bifunctional ADP-heptose synthase (sugar kinase/adenylyltransferase)